MLAAVLPASLPAVHRVQAAEDTGAVRVGRWRPPGLPAGTSFGDLAVVSASNQRILYGTTSQRLFAWSLDSLQSIAAPATIDDPDAVAVDEDGDLVAAFPGAGGYVAAYHVHGGAVVERGRVALSTPLELSERVLSLRVAEGGRRVFVLSMVDRNRPVGPGARTLHAVPGSVTLRSVDLSGQGAGQWAVPLRECMLPVSLQSPPALGYDASSRSVYFGCAIPRNDIGNRTPLPTGVGRVVADVGGPGPFELFPRVGDFSAGDSVFDPTSGRLLLVSQFPNAGANVFAFDTETESWVGAIALGGNGPAQVGVDVAHSRFYALAQDVGLLGADIGATPVLQGVTHPSLMADEGKLPLGRRWLFVDETRSRIFLTYTGQDEFVVVEDRVPYYKAPVPPDPDDNTMQVDEREGVTGVNYSAAAQGYGARYRWVGGTAAAFVNFFVVDGVATALPLGSGTREVSHALIDSVAFRNGEASAGVIAADRDVSSTGKDTQGEWPYRKQTCIDSGGGRDAANDADTAVQCDAAKEATTMAVSGANHVEGPGFAMDIGASSTESTLRRDPEKGVVATVTSTARGVSLLGGALRFGRVTTTATAQAAGRTGTAKSTLVRDLRDVWVNGHQVCGDDCDPKAVAAAVNPQFRGSLRIDFPEPDRALLASDGGYQAVVRSSPEQQIEAVTLNEQANDRIEVPGMLVTFFADNSRPSRVIVQLAGTEVEARYGIFLLGGAGRAAITAGGMTDNGGGLQAALDALLGGGGAPGSGVGGLAAATGGRPAGSSGGLLPSGWAFLRRALPETLPVLLVWGMLLAPVYLSARRRLLLERGTVLVDG